MDLNGNQVNLITGVSLPLAGASLSPGGSGTTLILSNGQVVGTVTGFNPVALAYVTVGQRSSNNDTVILQAAAGLGTATLPTGTFGLQLYASPNVPGFTSITSSSASFVYIKPTVQAPTAGSIPGSFAITGTIAPALTGSASVTFYATTGTTPGTGRRLLTATVAGGLSVDGQGNVSANLGALTASLPPGSYSIYAILSDGVNSPVVSGLSITQLDVASAVMGMVLSPGGQAIAGIEVALYLNATLGSLPATPDFVTYTRADGSFAFAGTPGSAFSGVVRVSPVAGDSVAGASAVTVSYNGQTPTSASFTLIPAAAITGIVTDPPLDSPTPVKVPLVGSVVFLDLNHNGRLDADEPTTRTNTRGQYSFRGIAPGTYSVGVVDLDGFALNTPKFQDVTIADAHDRAIADGFDFRRADGRTSTSTITYPSRTFDGVRTWLGKVGGTANDPYDNTHLAGVKVSVQDRTTGKYWDGTAFRSDTAVELLARGRTAWSLDVPTSALADGHSYEIRSIAFSDSGIDQAQATAKQFTYNAVKATVSPTPNPDPTPTPTPNPNPTPTPTLTAPAVVVTPVGGGGRSLVGETIIWVIRVGSTVPSQPAATGTVTVRDGSTVLATLGLVDGVATFRTSALAVGTHALSVAYGGDAQFLAAVSAVTIQEVGLARLDPGIPAQGGSLAVAGSTVDLTGVAGGRRVQVSVADGSGPAYVETFDRGALAAIQLRAGSGDQTVRIRGRFAGPMALQRAGVAGEGQARPTARLTRAPGRLRAQLLTLGGGAEEEVVRLIGDRTGSRVRVVVRRAGQRRPVFSRTFAANRLAGVVLQAGAGTQTVRVRGQVATSVVFQAASPSA